MANYVPRQGTFGFDTGMFLIRWLSSRGADTPLRHSGIQNGFNFVRVPDGGWVTASVSGVSAQRQYEPKLYLGGKAGATFSSMQFSPHVKQALVQGVTAGMTVRYTEENIFGLIGELCVTQRGWKEGFEKDDGPWKYDRKLTYITLPVLCHIYFGSSRVKGFVNLGP